jgi:8-oxo-dGTP pyrophosphatase MutT (NUDIX family)
MTPLLAVKCGVFDDRGRALVMERADTGEWDMPGGKVDAMEPPRRPRYGRPPRRRGWRYGS